MATATGVTQCARHPETETGLRCQKCGTPICPRCMVQTPVGARCPACAQVLRSPIYTLNRGQQLRAAGAAAAGGTVMGLIWGGVLLPFTAGFGIIGVILVGIALGWVFIRVLNFATGYKRGPAVTAFAVTGIVLAWAIMAAMVIIWYDAPVRVAVTGLLPVGIGIYFAYQNLSRL